MTSLAYIKWQNQLLIRSIFFYIKSQNKFFSMNYEIYPMKAQVIINCLVQLSHYLQVNSISCKFLNYILFLAKLFDIKTWIKIFIFHPIISKKDHIFTIKLFYLFLFLITDYKNNHVINISFNNRYVKIVISPFNPNFAKNASSLKSFSKIINNIFIINHFDFSTLI